MQMNDQLKLKRTSKNQAIDYKKLKRKMMSLNLSSMHSNNAAETINQNEFYLGPIIAQNDDVLD